MTQDQLPYCSIPCFTRFGLRYGLRAVCRLAFKHSFQIQYIILAQLYFMHYSDVYFGTKMQKSTEGNPDNTSMDSNAVWRSCDVTHSSHTTTGDRDRSTLPVVAAIGEGKQTFAISHEISKASLSCNGSLTIHLCLLWSTLSTYINFIPRLEITVTNRLGTRALTLCRNRLYNCQENENEPGLFGLPDSGLFDTVNVGDFFRTMQCQSRDLRCIE